MSTEGFRLLHTMLRVTNLEASVGFYTAQMGMTELSRKDVPEGKFTLVFLGYGPVETHCVLELTYNWDRDSYELGDGFGHLAIAVPDAYAVCERLRAAGVNITREPGPLKFGTTVIAFIEDPDGYKIELVQRS